MPQEQDYIAALIEQLKKLPGIGPRSAERIAFHILVAGHDESMALAYAIRAVKKKLRPCRECFNATAGELCSICSDPRRDRGVVCVVEQLRDLAAIERTGSFRGTYHVLLGALSPLEGIEEGDLTLTALLQRVKKGKVHEVVLATNPNLEGDNTALRIWELLQDTGVTITRLARGIAVGGQLGYSSKSTVADAFESRQVFREK